MRTIVGREPKRAVPLRPTCPHGHAWTPENTLVNRDGVRVCRTCNRAAGVRWRRENGVRELGRVSAGIVEALRRAPHGLSLVDLRARLGHTSSVDSIRVTICRLRVHRGVPIVSVNASGIRRYVLRDQGEDAA